VGDKITMSDSLIITIFSMAIVFISLLIISYLIKGSKVITNKGTKMKKTSQKLVAKEANMENIKDDENEELIAIISAAVAASLGVSIPEMNIKSIKRISTNECIWSRVGREQQMFKRL
jgi:sodium pump decarboxylase gamma subunit